jgi:predicted DNA-binding transcriptional regulator YafY
MPIGSAGDGETLTEKVSSSVTFVGYDDLMSRADRLDALLAFLRARERTSVAEIAEAFGVSERTVFRDLDALRARDVPIEGEAGRGGGLQLLPHGALPAVRLDLEEAAALALAVGLAQQASGVPFSRAAERARQRVLAALPQRRRADLRRLQERIVIGPPASANVASTAEDAEPGVLEAVEQAFTALRGLAFHYTDRNGHPSERRVEPHGILLQWPVWYVLAWDLRREGPRMFRMDRMRRVRRLDDVTILLRPVEVVEALAAPMFAWAAEAADPA